MSKAQDIIQALEKTSDPTNLRGAFNQYLMAVEQKRKPMPKPLFPSTLSVEDFRQKRVDEARERLLPLLEEVLPDDATR